MKKLQLIVLWILMIALCGCGKKEEQIDKYTNQEPETTEALTETDTESAEPETNHESYENWYRIVLDSNYELIMGGADAYEYRDGTSGIGEVIMNSDEIEANTIVIKQIWRTCGFCLKSIKRNGTALLPV